MSAMPAGLRLSSVPSDAGTGAAAEQPFVAVAKIFDPLYYPFVTWDGDEPWADDIIFAAQEGYANESAAYERLTDAGLAGTVAPKYFGSWQFTLPVTGPPAEIADERSVRLVLMEYVDGKSVQDHYAMNSDGLNATPDAFHLPEEYRLDIIAKTLEANISLLRAGVERRRALKNVMVVSPTVHGQDPEPPRVVTVGYNNAHLDQGSKMHDWPDYPYNHPVLPFDPLKMFIGEGLLGFGAWLPLEWQESPAVRKAWVLGRFGRTIAPTDPAVDEPGAIIPGRGRKRRRLV